MGEKVYKPVLDEGSHLLRSSDNPDRVRGLSRDIDNRNPGIPEWVEYDLDDLTKTEYAVSSNFEERNQLLSGRHFFLDLNTSRELFSLTGGGVWLNNAYIPVQTEKIDTALKALPTQSVTT